MGHSTYVGQLQLHPLPKRKERKAPSQNKTEEMCEIQHINSMKAIVKIGFRVASIKLKQKDKMEL